MNEPADYILRSGPAEQQRLLKQADAWRAEACWLLDRLAIRSGWGAIDIGCGPLGILDLLAERVGPIGRVVGLDQEPRMVEMARNIVAERNLTNVEIIRNSATATGLPRESFDLVHAGGMVKRHKEGGDDLGSGGNSRTETL